MINPVVVSQLFTGYIDQYIYYFLLLSICLIIKIGKEKNSYIHDLFLLYLITIFAIGTKFNAFFFQGLTLIMATIWFGINRQWHLAKSMIATGLLGLISVIVFYWHPYITNIISNGHPLYPLLGENSINIMYPPSVFEDHNRFYNFFLSLIYTWISPNEHGLFVCFDQRRCGFTLWMVPLLLLTFISLVIYFKNWSKISLYIFFSVFLSCFIFEETWWARYIPQLWLLPVIAMINSSYQWKYTILGLTILALMMSGLNNWFYLHKNTQWNTHLLKSLSGMTIIPSGKLSTSDKYILKEYNINWTEPKLMPNQTMVFHQGISFCIDEESSE